MKKTTILNLMRRAALSLVLLGQAGGISTAQANYTMGFEDNTGLGSGQFSICMQGFATGKPSGDPPLGPALVMNATGRFEPLPSAPVSGTPTPYVRVSPGSTLLTYNNDDFGIVGSRVYFYISSNTDCKPYMVTYNGGGQPSGPANSVLSQYPPHAFVEGTAGKTGGTAGDKLYINLSMVDSFLLPSALTVRKANAPGNYSRVGQTNTEKTGHYFTWERIYAEYKAWMGAANRPGRVPYKVLVEDYASPYPPNTGAIRNPHSFLMQLHPGATTFLPNAADPLNAVFEAALNTFFSQAIQLDDTTSFIGANYTGTPVSDLPSGNPQIPMLKGMAFCQTGVTPCTKDTSGAIWLYNPVGLTVMANGSSVILGQRDNTDQHKLNFTPALQLPAGQSLLGMYTMGAKGNWSTGNFKVASCTPSCDGPASVQSVTLADEAGDIATADSQQWVFGTLPPGIDGRFSSSGDQVFGNMGVFGGTLSHANANLGNLIVSAFNRGVATLDTHSSYWSVETNWYPANAVINEYSNFLHTFAMNGSNLFQLPTDTVPPPENQFARSKQGAPMGMAYGFAYDENPVNGGPSAFQVPSKYDAITSPSTPLPVGETLLTLRFGRWPEATGYEILTLTKTDNGAVSSSPAGIDCESTCTADVLSAIAGTKVTLSAKPDTGYLFGGWTGDCSAAGTSLDCEVTMTSAKSVGASFTPTAKNKIGLSVTVTGNGKVTGSDLNCDPACSGQFDIGTVVTLTAAASTGLQFQGWTGDCSGTLLTCQLTMSEDRYVGAAFATIGYSALSVSPVPTGGTVTSNPGPINCGPSSNVCIAGYSPGTKVTVVAIPAAGYIFTGWTGDCPSSGTGVCDLTMNGAHRLGAQFAETSLSTLTVHAHGGGGVHSVDGGIKCGTDCTESYPAGARVVLAATPAPGYYLHSWTGACAGSGSCEVPIGSREWVGAVFATGATSLPVPVPALSEWALLLLSILTLGTALVVIRGRWHG
ncbi:IPTL-CTERM sorting domain-containing protein [Candidatus Thiodictyon syntrophicum]|uniref:Bacterial repeat domain-containing protein n=1 Tax=Candidatus Thiodictyon syntrophicum TaxID=1166950 RepID=A0A2K8UG75_9GAMM|nr:IPTL-CTERM sorting domain-containing protein [Candidatus Thiodictyon syntrophicum]AUB84576.1 hypothetical protein THSYN_29020 [Candidatus Thiodictyon syntrophicum]